MRIQPDDTAWPIVSGSFEPWMRKERRAEIYRAGAKRALDSARHVSRQIGAALAHLGRRGPSRPFLLAGDGVDPSPFKTGTPDADAVAQGGAVIEDELETVFG